MTNNIDRRSPSAQAYSAANETNPLFDGAAYHESVDYADAMTLGQVAEAKGRITRVRILGGGPSDGFMADISYIHATLPSGKVVPLHQDYPMCFPIRKAKAELIAWAKQYGVFAKGLGLLDEGNWSVLR